MEYASHFQNHIRSTTIDLFKRFSNNKAGGNNYAAAGTYPVSLTVTDNDGATDLVSKDVTVNFSGSSKFTLSVSAYKIRGASFADLTWSGATSTDVDIYRDDIYFITTAKDEEYTDNFLGKGGVTATYQVCEAGTETPNCSNSVTVSW